MHKTLISRVIGYLASLILTLTAFFIAFYPEFTHLKNSTTFSLLFTFAFLQFILQSVCFLNVWDEKGPRWKFLTFISTISGIIIIIVGTLWIMHHLNYHMML